MAVAKVAHHTNHTDTSIIPSRNKHRETNVSKKDDDAQSIACGENPNLQQIEHLNMMLSGGVNNVVPLFT
jgi:hypothetical protein